jgi:hypothetical protein
MRSPLALLFCGLFLSILGGATASDAVSLREVCHGLPLLGELVTALRLGMGTSMAHALEPAIGVLGGGVMLLALRVAPPKAIRALVPVRA